MIRSGLVIVQNCPGTTKQKNYKLSRASFFVYDFSKILLWCSFVSVHLCFEVFVVISCCMYRYFVCFSLSGIVFHFWLLFIAFLIVVCALLFHRFALFFHGFQCFSLYVCIYFRWKCYSTHMDKQVSINMMWNIGLVASVKLLVQDEKDA